MNCADVRQRLLLSERPDKPGPVESRHLVECSTCQNWLRRLVRLERRITELQVPHSPVPQALLEQITETETDSVVSLSVKKPSAKPRSVREVGRQKLALAFSLAATLTLFTLAWWAWPPRSVQQDPGVLSTWSEIIERRKQSTPNPRERVAVLAALADELLADAQANADNSLYVGQVAEDFQQLTRDLQRTAETLSPADRTSLLEVVERISRTESRAGRLAAEWKSRRPNSARALDEMARSARETMQRLRRLARA